LTFPFVVDREAFAIDTVDEAAVSVHDSRGQHDELARRAAEMRCLLPRQRGTEGECERCDDDDRRHCHGVESAGCEMPGAAPSAGYHVLFNVAQHPALGIGASSRCFNFVQPLEGGVAAR